MSDCMSDIPAVFLLTDERLNELAQADLGRVLPTEYANLRDKFTALLQFAGAKGIPKDQLAEVLFHA